MKKISSVFGCHCESSDKYRGSWQSRFLGLLRQSLCFFLAMTLLWIPVFTGTASVYAKEPVNPKNPEYIQWKSDLDSAKSNYQIFKWTAYGLFVAPVVVLPFMVKDQFGTWLAIWIVGWCASLGSYAYAGTFQDEIQELEYQGKKKGYVSLTPVKNKLTLCYSRQF